MTQHHTGRETNPEPRKIIAQCMLAVIAHVHVHSQGLIDRLLIQLLSTALKSVPV